MDKERQRPSIDRRLKKIVSNGRSSSKKDIVDHELRSCDLIDGNGSLKQISFQSDVTFQPEETDRAEEVTAEVGISLEVLEVFAEEQNIVPLTNGHALLDDQFPPFNPRMPRDIIGDDYSEDSMP